MQVRNNMILFLMSLSIFSYNPILTNDTDNNPIIENRDEALSIMIQENEDRINRTFALCENEDEDMATFMEKAHSLFKEHTQWQRNNPSLLSDLDLAQAIDSLWIDALKKLEQSFEDETNPLLQEKKMIAIQTINEALKGHCYLCDIQK